MEATSVLYAVRNYSAYGVYCELILVFIGLMPPSLYLSGRAERSQQKFVRRGLDKKQKQYNLYSSECIRLGVYQERRYI